MNNELNNQLHKYVNLVMHSPYTGESEIDNYKRCFSNFVQNLLNAKIHNFSNIGKKNKKVIIILSNI